VTRLFSHPHFAPILALIVFLWGTTLAAFLLVAPALKATWADTLLVSCFGFNPATRAYRLDTLILYLLQPPLFVTVIGFFYAAEFREFVKSLGGKVAAVGGPFLFLTASAFVVASSAISASGTAVRPETVQMPLRQGGQAPDFTLTDHRGSRVALTAQRGQVVALTFFYSNCHATCPALISRLRHLEDRFPGEDLLLIAVTLDPSRDDVARLAAHAERWSLGQRWRLLTGEMPAVTAALKAYGVQTVPLPNGEIGHENLLLLIDRRGRLAYVYRGLGHPEERLAEGLRALIQERG
jgi:protein SCO1/2